MEFERSLEFRTARPLAYVLQRFGYDFSYYLQAEILENQHSARLNTENWIYVFLIFTLKTSVKTFFKMLEILQRSTGL
jgi:hypothetical protein